MDELACGSRLGNDLRTSSEWYLVVLDRACSAFHGAAEACVSGFCLALRLGTWTGFCLGLALWISGFCLEIRLQSMERVWPVSRSWAWFVAGFLLGSRALDRACSAVHGWGGACVLGFCLGVNLPSLDASARSSPELVPEYFSKPDSEILSARAISGAESLRFA